MQSHRSIIFDVNNCVWTSAQRVQLECLKPWNLTTRFVAFDVALRVIYKTTSFSLVIHVNSSFDVLHLASEVKRRNTTDDNWSTQESVTVYVYLCLWIQPTKRLTFPAVCVLEMNPVLRSVTSIQGWRDTRIAWTLANQRTTQRRTAVAR